MLLECIRKSNRFFKFSGPLTISFLSLLQMSALKSANKELKGMMKTVKIQDIDVCA
jgi:hypothetical protein